MTRDECFLCVGDGAPCAPANGTRLNFLVVHPTFDLLQRRLESDLNFRMQFAGVIIINLPVNKRETVNGEILISRPSMYHGTFGQERFICNCGGFSQDIRDAITTGGGLYGGGGGREGDGTLMRLRSLSDVASTSCAMTSTVARLSSHRRRHGGCMIYFRLSPFRALRFPPSISSSRFERATCVRLR